MCRNHPPARPAWRSLTGARRCCVLFALACVGFTGCAQPRRQFAPAIDPAGLSDTAFLHYLARTPVVTVDEGTRAVLLLVGSTSEWSSPQERMDELLRRGAIKAAWRLKSDQVLDVGTLAYTLRVVCGVPPGLNDRIGKVTGLADRRAAVRTCHYAGLMPYAVPHAPVTGGALLAALTHGEAYVDAASADTTRVKPSRKR